MEQDGGTTASLSPRSTHTERHENAQSHTRNKRNASPRVSSAPARAPTPARVGVSRRPVVCHVDVAGSNHTIYTYKQLCDLNQNYKHVRPTMAPPPPKKAIFGFGFDDTRRRRRRRPNAETDDGYLRDDDVDVRFFVDHRGGFVARNTDEGSSNRYSV